MDAVGAGQIGKNEACLVPSRVGHVQHVQEEPGAGDGRFEAQIQRRAVVQRMTIRIIGPVAAGPLIEWAARDQ